MLRVTCKEVDKELQNWLKITTPPMLESLRWGSRSGLDSTKTKFLVMYLELRASVLNLAVWFRPGSRADRNTTARERERCAREVKSSIQYILGFTLASNNEKDQMLLEELKETAKDTLDLIKELWDART